MTPLILKLSGKALGAENELLKLFATLRALGQSFLLVHGGGVEVDRLMAVLGREVKRVDGLRVSSPEDMPYIAGALAGTCSLQLRGLAIKAGLFPVGLVATDLGLSSVAPQDPALGRVARALPGNESARQQLISLLAAGLTPVLSSVGIDSAGRLWNINADDAALAVAQLLKAPLVFLSDVRGVLDSEKKLLSTLTQSEAEALVERGVISGGMTVKVKAAFAAARTTGAAVAVASVFDESLSETLSAGKLPGTVFLCEEC